MSVILRKQRCVLLFAALLLGSMASLAFAQAAPIRFSVRHKHRYGSCQGILLLNEQGMAYETAHREHGHRWLFRDLRHVEIVSPARLVLHAYVKPTPFDFWLSEGELTADAYRLLAAHMERGLTSRVLFPRAPSLYELPVKHNHRLGGCEGILRIGSAEIVYDTPRAEDRRLWRMRDLRGFGTAGRYNLRLSTENETFTFDLKQPLSQEVHDYLWKTLYGR